jgi:hypothetical protein
MQAGGSLEKGNHELLQGIINTGLPILSKIISLPPQCIIYQKLKLGIT